jgi:hypothetical protein
MYKLLFVMLVLAVLVLAPGCTTTTTSNQSPMQPTATPTFLLTTGSLKFSSTPQGAEIYLNDVYRGTTPSTIPDLPNGSYHVELRLRDHTEWNRDVEVQAGNTSYIDATLVPLAVPTTIPTPVPTATLPKTVVGCWKAEYYVEDSVGAYTYQFQSGNVGMLSFAHTSPTESRTLSESFTWFYNLDSTMITVQPEKAGPLEFTYDENTDILIWHAKTDVVLERVPCE